MTDEIPLEGGDINLVVLGIDEQGREILTYVEGEPAFAPVPYSDEIVADVGRLLREAHDAQAGFVPPLEPGWAREDSRGPEEVIGHGDLFWTNVIFRDGRPAALIDWGIARPMTRTLDVALAATYWAGLRIDRQLVEWGLPLDHRGERLRLLCDSYGLDQRQRAALFDELIEHRRKRLEQREWRGVVPRDIIVANLDWAMDQAPKLSTFLD